MHAHSLFESFLHQDGLEHIEGALYSNVPAYRNRENSHFEDFLQILRNNLYFDDHKKNLKGISVHYC